MYHTPLERIGIASVSGRTVLPAATKISLAAPDGTENSSADMQIIRMSEINLFFTADTSFMFIIHVGARFCNM